MQIDSLNISEDDQDIISFYNQKYQIDLYSDDIGNFNTINFRNDGSFLIQYLI